MSHRSRTWLILALLAFASAGMSACEDKPRPQQTVLQIKRQYATKFVDGVTYGHAGVIKAERIEPDTYDLINIRIDDGDRRMLHADRAELIIDPAADTLSLQLRGIVKADADVGHLITEHGMMSRPIDLDVDVVP